MRHRQTDQPTNDGKIILSKEFLTFLLVNASGIKTEMVMFPINNKHTIIYDGPSHFILFSSVLDMLLAYAQGKGIVEVGLK